MSMTSIGSSKLIPTWMSRAQLTTPLIGWPHLSSTDRRVPSGIGQKARTIIPPALIFLIRHNSRLPAIDQRSDAIQRHQPVAGATLFGRAGRASDKE
jgi:hypothetical protein